MPGRRCCATATGGWGRSHELASNYSAALATYEEMLAFAGDREDRVLETSALSAIAAILWTSSAVADLDRSFELAHLALDLARETGSRADLANVHWVLMNLEARRDNTVQALEHGEASLEISRELGLRTQLAYTLNDVHFIHLTAGDPVRARESLLEARELWIDLGNRPMQADNIWVFGALEYLLGDFSEVLRLAEEELELSTATSNIWGISYGYFLRAWPHYEWGIFQEALNALKSVVQYAEVGENTVAAVTAQAHIAQIYRDLGQLEASNDYIHQAMSEIDAIPEVFQTVPRMIYGNLLVSQGDIDGAHQGLEGVEPSNWFFGLIYQPFAPGNLALAEGDGKRANQIADDMLENIRGLSLRLPITDALLLKGRGLNLAGDHEAAREIFEAARVEAEDLGTRRILWEIYRELSLNAAQLGDADAESRYRSAARDEIEYIASHLSDSELRRSFLDRPRVREITDDR